MKFKPVSQLSEGAQVASMGLEIEMLRHKVESTGDTINDLKNALLIKQAEWEKLSFAFEQDIPSITQQTDWPCNIFDFGKSLIPGIQYFNSGLIDFAGKRWLVTRRSSNRMGQPFGFNDVMAFEMDGISLVRGQKVKFQGTQEEQFEDPRVIRSGPNVLISCCNFIWRGRTWTGAHQTLHVVDSNWKSIARFDPVYGRNTDRLNRTAGNEKNWTWFMRDNQLFMVYMTRPHLVVKFSNEIKAIEVFQTQLPAEAWMLGEPRGGTPPILIGDEYWSFFHSSVPWRGKFRRYYMGAYAFKASPPFQPTRITPKPLLAGSKNDLWFEGKPLVVFPCGAIMENDTWLITGGCNDLQAFWIKIPHGDLLELAKSI